jgi:hypothetical protein
LNDVPMYIEYMIKTSDVSVQLYFLLYSVACLATVA